MQKLIQGLHEFQTSIFSTRRELFEKLAAGQKPDALLITCSDSRINPHLLTQAQPGDLFILRNAGNIVPRHGCPVGGEAATIEYAIEALKIRDIIICGHSHCGAMKAVLDPDSAGGLPLVSEWLEHASATRQIILEKYLELSGPQRLTAAVQENVLVQLENLRSLPVVARALDSGRLHVHGWVYKFETGEVFSFEPQSGQFVASSARNGAVATASSVERTF